MIKWKKNKFWKSNGGLIYYSRLPRQTVETLIRFFFLYYLKTLIQFLISLNDEKNIVIKKLNSQMQ